jgi:hypothetical protein
MNYVALAIRKYGMGRISIITDKISGIKTYSGKNKTIFWKKLLCWCSQKYQKEIINIGILDFSKSNLILELNQIHNIIATKIELNNFCLNKLNLLYFSGLPLFLDDKIKFQIKQFVENGGGVLIENPNIEKQNINAIEMIDNIYVHSINRPNHGIAYWTQSGFKSEIYENDINIEFLSCLKREVFNNKWEILLSDIKFSDLNYDNTDYINNSTGAEFGISFISSMNNGLTKIDSDKNYIFNPNKFKVYAAKKKESILCFYESDVLLVNNIIKWNNIKINKSNSHDFMLFVKNCIEIEEFNEVKWEKINSYSDINISYLSKPYLKFLFIWNIQNMNVLNLVDSIELSYFSKGDFSTFVTKEFNLKCKPKHIILTYNADMTDNSIINFAICEDNSLLNKNYIYIKPNEINELPTLTSNKFKIIIEMIGESNLPVKLHEIALMHD